MKNEQKCLSSPFPLILRIITGEHSQKRKIKEKNINNHLTANILLFYWKDQKLSQNLSATKLEQRGTISPVFNYWCVNKDTQTFLA